MFRNAVDLRLVEIWAKAQYGAFGRNGGKNRGQKKTGRNRVQKPEPETTYTVWTAHSLNREKFATEENTTRCFI